MKNNLSKYLYKKANKIGLNSLSSNSIVLFNKTILCIFNQKFEEAQLAYKELVYELHNQYKNGQINLVGNSVLKHFIQILNDISQRRLNPEALKSIKLKGSEMTGFQLTQILSVIYEKANQKLLKEKEEKELREKRERQIKIEKEKEAKLKIRKILNTTRNGIRINWNLNIKKVAEEIGQNLELSDLIEIKKEIATEWIKDIGLRAPTEEQIKFIIDTDSSIRMTARAGSGKTEMVATKIIFLIYYLGYSHDELLALTFNVSAREDLKNRVLKLINKAELKNKQYFPIMNFDRLSNSFSKRDKKIARDLEQNQIIKRIVKEFLNKENVNSSKLKSLLLKSFRSDWEKWINATEKYTQKELNQLRYKLKNETINGVVIKSRGEKRIGDFLFEHDIDFIYERPFSFKGKKIYPDFYLPKEKLIIEYYGLLGNKEYEEEVKYKQEFYGRNKYLILELTKEDFQTFGADFMEGREEDYFMLTKKLKNICEENNLNLKIKRLSDEEIIEKIRRKIELAFEELVEQSVNRLNTISNDLNEIDDFIFNYEPITDEEKDFIDLLPSIYKKYKHYLKEQKMTNFSEIMWNCISKIESGETNFETEKGNIKVNFKKLKFLFIDEFQDFSFIYQELIKTILKVSNNLLINAVGDDWQMIYRFMGSDLKYFNNFANYFKNPKELFLTTNFRSAKPIVDFCNSIMENNGVISKYSDSNHKLNGEIFNFKLNELEMVESEKFLFNSDIIISSLLRLLPFLIKITNFESRFRSQVEKRIEEKIKFSYVLSRVKNLSLRLRRDNNNLKFIEEKKDNGIKLLEEFLAKVYQKHLYPYAVKASTAHSAKGGEADTVIIINPHNFGKIHPSSQFMRIFGDYPEVLIEDERKLFYVACSRAKEKLIFLSEKDNSISEFIKDEKIIPTEKWAKFPYKRKVIPNLFRIDIRNIPNQKSFLYEKRNELEAYGFKLEYLNEIAIRRKVLKTSLKEAAEEIIELIDKLKGCDLYFILLDSADRKIFEWPGNVSTKDFYDSLQK